MDVLQLLKSEFRERKADLDYLKDPSTKDGVRKSIRKALNTHLAWESGYLLPELSHLASKGDGLLDRYEQSLRRLDSLSAGQSDVEVAEAFVTHTEIVEEKVLPFMRQKIPTAEREELYHVFADAKQELLASSPSGYVN